MRLSLDDVRKRPVTGSHLRYKANMQLDADVCYQALRSRDGRFDGKFFVAVSTTGIYCRPVCPARTPKRENVRFFPCAAAAEEAGFRACRRCRPETAPDTPAWQGTSATVTRALRLLTANGDDAVDVERLAAQLGIGSRHLRRLFAETLGASPSSIVRTRRVHMARRLIDSTQLPIAQIAFASGFNSIRRFNEAMRLSFGESPRRMRARTPMSRRTPNGGAIEATLCYRPPLDWAALLAFLGARAIPGIEAVEGQVYRRTIEVCGEIGTIEVQPVAQRHQLRLQLQLGNVAHLGRVIQRVRFLLDLDGDPAAIKQALAGDSFLLASLQKRPGLRVPGCWDAFELAVRAILGQQVTVKGATTLAGRLVERFGSAIPTPIDEKLTHVFPSAARLADADVAVIGLPQARAATIRALSQAVVDGAIDWEEADASRLTQQLCAIRGIGDWTAQYIAMRALGEPDVFLASDLAVRQALSNGDGKLIAVKAAEARAHIWRPWRAYAVMHLWSAHGEAKAKATASNC